MHLLRRLTEQGTTALAATAAAVGIAGLVVSIDLSSLSPPVLALLGAAVGGVLVTVISLAVRSAVRVEVGGLRVRPAAADEGALLLDYVKPTSLVDLAEQLDVDTPKELERLESSTSDVSAKAGTPGLELAVGQQEQTQVTRSYERSLNVLAGDLLGALEERDRLAVRRDLALLPASKDREVLAHLEALEALGIELGDDAPTPEEIRSRFETEIAQKKRRVYTEVASTDRVPFALVKGRWRVVDRAADAMTLELATLVPDDGTEPQPMPAGVGLHAHFEKALLTDMGRGRLIPSDIPIPATILGAPAGMTGNILRVNPVIIFTRYGGSSRSYQMTSGRSVDTADDGEPSSSRRRTYATTTSS